MSAVWRSYEDLVPYARENSVVFTLVRGMPLEQVLDSLRVVACDFVPLPPPGSTSFDF